jgi:hypothetical protein
LSDDLPVFFIKAQLNLSSTLDDMNAVLEAIAALNVKPKLLIVDTFARVFHGEENSAKEVGESIAIFGHMQDVLGCGVLLVHHAGKDTARGMRGSSALLGAVDLELECTKISEEGSSQRVGKLTVTKQKDGEDGVELGYKMDVIQLSDIDPEYTSLALEPITGEDLLSAQGKASKGAAPINKNAQILAKSLSLATVEAGVQPPIGDRCPKGVRAVQIDTLRHYFANSCSLDRASMRKAFTRACEELQTKGLLDIWNGWAWEIKKKGPPALQEDDDAPF